MSRATPIVEKILQRRVGPALICEEGEISYERLGEAICATAYRMMRARVSHGRAVGIVETSPFEFIVAYFATHLIGAIAVPIYPHIGSRTIAGILQRVPLAASFSPCDFPHPLPRPMKIFEGSTSVHDFVFPALNSTADLHFHSGPDGGLIGVERSHENQFAVARRMSRFVGNRSTDRELLPVPLSHPFGLGRLLSVLLNGGAVILCNGVGRPDHLFELMSKWRATGLSLLSSSWALLERLSGDQLGRFKSQLRYIELGGGRLSVEQKLRLVRLLPRSRLCSSYGWPEEPHSTHLSFRDSMNRVESEGRAAPGVQIAVRDELGRPVPAGRSGQIWIRRGGGWSATGERGRLDLQGYLYSEGVAKGMIWVGGWPVSAREVEEVLLTHPAISGAEVVAAADPIMGEVVCAHLTGHRLSHAQLFAHVRQQLEPHKVPVRVRWVGI